MSEMAGDLFQYDFKPEDIFMVGDAEIRDKGLVHHHLESMNDLYENGIPQIITQIFAIEKHIENARSASEEDRDIMNIHVEVKFSNVEMKRPMTVDYQSGKEVPLFPKSALLQDKTYSAALYVDTSIKATAFLKNGMHKERSAEVKKLKLCKMPVMVRSSMCHTYGLTRDNLLGLEEDPSDEGGYFIVKGVEWVIDCAENVLFNDRRIFYKENYMKEMYRCEFISRPGDTYQNSGQVVVRWLRTGAITVEVVHDKLDDIQLPFYAIFRALGWSSDKEVFDNVLLEYESSNGQRMYNFMKEAYEAPYDTMPCPLVYEPSAILKVIAEGLKDATKGFKYLQLDNHPENYQQAIKSLMRLLDANLFPHIGKRPEDRHAKLRYLAMTIRDIFKVRLGIVQETDRDSYKSKRIFAAGGSYAKAFKSLFRASNIQQINKRILKDFKAMSFSQVDLVACIKSSIYGDDFERLMIQSITSGTRPQINVSQQRKVIKNRLSSNQLLSRKNQLSSLFSLRQVVASVNDSKSKQSDRATTMRRVHNSFLGYICLVHASESEACGVNKQLACLASICKASSSEFLKQRLLQDEELYRLSNLDHTDLVAKHNVFVNGDWIGAVDNSLAFAQKYRELRRLGDINPMTSICWKNTRDELYFWVDAGRMARPLLICYNTERDAEFLKKLKHKALVGTIGGASSKSQSSKSASKEAKTQDSAFEQGILLTKDILDGLYAGTVDIHDLLKAQIIEYITADEQDNCYICSSFEELKANKNDRFHKYTHCEIPESQVGLTAHVTPFSSHNQTIRNTFESLQVRQACGYFAMNWPFRCDKETFLQYVNEIPLTSTIVNRYLYPNGLNVMVAVMINSGFNQEDSIIINRGSIDCGIFDGCAFKFERTELEQKEEFGVPNISNTTDIKAANYDKLDENGFIRIGAVINKGDALVGKYVKLPSNPDSAYLYADRSLIYRDEETAIVHNVVISMNEDAQRVAKVIFRKPRRVVVGDKMCIRETAEVLTQFGWIQLKDFQVKKHKVASMVNGALCFVWAESKYLYEHDGPLIELKSESIHSVTTLNHKHYVRRVNRDSQFQLIEAQHLSGETVQFKTSAANGWPDYKTVIMHNDSLGLTYTIDIELWLKFVGAFIANGHLNKTTFTLIWNAEIQQVCQSIHIETKKESDLLVLLKFECNDMLLKVQALYNHIKYCDLPQELWKLGADNSRSLLKAIVRSKVRLDDDTQYDVTQLSSYCADQRMANLLSRLALHAEMSSTIEMHNDAYLVRFNLNTCPTVTCPIIMECHEDCPCHSDPMDQSDCQKIAARFSDEVEGAVMMHLIPFSGRIGCLEVPPQHVFYYREGPFSPPMWTGNSSRSGQKGICALTMRGSDMPFDKDGITPDIIFNPIGFPKRMTISQIIEMAMGIVCAKQGTTMDATMFRPIDEDALSRQLESYGFNKYGGRKLYNGVTGEPIDAAIYMGPIYYQRLQKFINDQNYSIAKGPSNGLTRQPIDGGKNLAGGLRMGEMELWTIEAHGTMQFLNEKIYSHGDKFTEYICRTCGRAAIVNEAEQYYRCRMCKDLADIAKVETCYAAKLFNQEIDSMNIGTRRYLEPYVFDVQA